MGMTTFGGEPAYRIELVNGDSKQIYERLFVPGDQPSEVDVDAYVTECAVYDVRREYAGLTNWTLYITSPSGETWFANNDYVLGEQQ